ncbi:GDSL-type esterase/lipase family protein [Rhodopirellula sallentina]|uniref:GDSL-type esterase/lipase family protein n=1 Tax=Rhodopirellula sallentina TaxID=1263869 RepID=UPI0005C7E1C5|nr:GDSL-type esterase/lipase family protein [Rhodopirellula sallentina]
MPNRIITFMATATVLVTSMVALAEGKTAPIKVACVGDSITFGFAIEDREHQSYPAQLAHALGDGWSVGNFGRNGRTVLKQGHAPYWDTREYKAALAMNPDIVIIKLGTNDLRPMNWEKHQADYVSDYVDLIRSFQDLDSEPKIWICYPVPVYPGHDKFKFGNEVIVNELIPKINEIAEQTGVSIIDLNTALSGKKKMFPDSIHPNAEGAKEIAKQVANAIMKHVSASAEQAHTHPSATH